MSRLSIVLLLFISSICYADKRFAEAFCHEADYFCLKTQAGDSWEHLFPNAEARDIVKRVNRMNIALRAGYIIAIPKNLDRLTIYDVSPFPRFIEPSGEKTIFVNQNKLAWGAYDEQGELIWWGPISSGTTKCRGGSTGCLTPPGSFRIVRKQDIECVSTAFPRRSDGNNGGAQMPFCMHFYRGYALHGSDTVPGYRASHGCVRLFTEDARWLNEEFIDVPGGGMRGTKVVIDDPRN